MDEAEWEMLRMRCEALARCASASSQARQGYERVEKKRRTRGSGDVVPKVPSKLRSRSEAENYASIMVPMVPPSVNHYVRHFGGNRHVKTEEAKTFHDHLWISSLSCKPVVAERFHVAITIFLGRKQKGDVDNFPKLVLDTLAKRGMFQDLKGRKLSDSHVTKLTVQKSRSVKNPRTVIFIEPSKDYLEEI